MNIKKIVTPDPNVMMRYKSKFDGQVYHFIQFNTRTRDFVLESAFSYYRTDLDEWTVLFKGASRTVKLRYGLWVGYEPYTDQFRSLCSDSQFDRQYELVGL